MKNWAMHLRNAGLDEGCELSLINYKLEQKITFDLIDERGAVLLHDGTDKGLNKSLTFIMDVLIAADTTPLFKEGCYYWVKIVSSSTWAVFRFKEIKGGVFVNNYHVPVKLSSCFMINPDEIQPPN